MSASRTIFGLAMAWAMLLSGCTSSPWNAPHSSGLPSATPAPAPPPTPPPAQAVTVNPQGMQEVLAEIQRAGSLDPATQEQLLRDLQQVDPSLWPQMVTQFRAQLAFAQRAKQQAAVATSNSATASAVATSANSAASSATPTAQAVSYVTRKDSDDKVVPAVAAAAEPPRKPALSSTASMAATSVEPTTAENVAKAEKKNAWREHLQAAIAAREAELRAEGQGPGAEARHAQLRMLYLLAGRRDDALRPIATASAASQAFWSEQLYGLATMIDEQNSGESSRRTAEAKEHLDDALRQLSQRCALVVRNLVFCKRIENFGCVEPFADTDFSPGQPVLLYAELENLVSQATARGQHTAIRSSYQIFDQRGMQLTEEQFTMTEEYCRRVRRDYYVSYKLYIPEKISPGKYTLKLTVEDLQGHNVAQSSVDFSIKKSR